MTDPQFQLWWEELIAELDRLALSQGDLLILKPHLLLILKAACKKVLQSSLGNL